MIKVIRQGAYFMEGRIIKENSAFMTSDKKEKAIANTISYSILKEHAIGSGKGSGYRFDQMIASDEDGVGAVHNAVSVGIDRFPIPFVTVESATGDAEGRCYARMLAERFGGDYVPSALAQETGYLTECAAASGEMILSRYPIAVGAIGAMGVPASDRQFMEQILQVPFVCETPETVVVYVKGKLRKGVGATDVSLALSEVLLSGVAEGKILEFIGPGIAGLSVESRTEIDFAVGEGGCFASVWQTDDVTEAYFNEHGKKGFKRLQAKEPAYYNGAMILDLTRIEPMIAVNGVIFKIASLTEEDLPDEDILYCDKDGKLHVTEASADLVGYEDIAAAAEMLRGKTASGRFNITPATAAVFKCAADNGYIGDILAAGASVGQSSDVEICLDVRSLCATALNGGILTSALEYDYVRRMKKFSFPTGIYDGVYCGACKPRRDIKIPDLTHEGALPLATNLLLKVGEAFPENYLSELGSFTPPKEVRKGSSAHIDDDALTFSDREVAFISNDIPDIVLTELAEAGILPLIDCKREVKKGDYLYLEGIADAVKRAEERVVVKRIAKGRQKDVVLYLPALSDEERKILLAGGLVSYYRSRRKGK